MNERTLSSTMTFAFAGNFFSRVLYGDVSIVNNVCREGVPSAQLTKLVSLVTIFNIFARETSNRGARKNKSSGVTTKRNGRSLNSHTLLETLT